MVKKGFLASVLFGVAAGACTLAITDSFELAQRVGVCVFVLAWSIIFSVALLYTVIDVYPKKLDRIADEIKYLNRRNNVNNGSEE